MIYLTFARNVFEKTAIEITRLCLNYRLYSEEHWLLIDIQLFLLNIIKVEILAYSKDSIEENYIEISYIYEFINSVNSK